MKASKSALTASADTFKNLATVSPIPGLKDMLNHAQERLNRMANSMQDDIDKLQKKIKKLHDFSNQTNGLFSNSLNELSIAMQGVLVLSGTVVNSDARIHCQVERIKVGFQKCIQIQIRFSDNHLLTLI